MRITKTQIKQILNYLYGNKSTRQLAEKEIICKLYHYNIKQIFKNAHNNKHRAYLDCQAVIHYLHITRQDYPHYINLTQTLLNIYNFKLRALMEYVWTNQSCKWIAHHNHLSINQVKKLHNNKLFIHCYNLTHNKHIPLGCNRYYLQHNYQYYTKFVHYNYGLVNLNGATTRFQSPNLCKDYQTKLQQLQKSILLEHIIATQLECPYITKLNGIPIKVTNNQYHTFSKKNIRVLKQHRISQQLILAVLACNLLISHRFGNRPRIIYYRNSKYRTLNDIYQSRQQVAKYDIKKYGISNHNQEIEKEKNLNLKFLINHKGEQV